jgi:hypothetical protein
MTQTLAELRQAAFAKLTPKERDAVELYINTLLKRVGVEYVTERQLARDLSDEDLLTKKYSEQIRAGRDTERSR